MKNITIDLMRLFFALFIISMSASAIADRGGHGNPHFGSDDRGGRYDQRDDDRNYNRYEQRNDNRPGMRYERRDYDVRMRHAQSDFRIDKRYQHNRSYPREGQIIKVIPKGRRPIPYRSKSYFYFGGSWYLPSDSHYVVVRPPIGIVVPILPAFYTTIWLGGIPYYYANDVYYTWRADLNGYQVAEPPVEAEEQPQPAYSADELFIYPKHNQSEQQQADDRYACHRWGVEQTHYDPTQPVANQSPNTLTHQREEYQRAMKACLEGKGYSVR